MGKLPLPFASYNLQEDHTRDLLHITDQSGRILAFIDPSGQLNGLPIWTLVTEPPTGSGTNYTLSQSPALVLCVFVNGIFQTPGTDYSLSGTQVTLTKALESGDQVYVVYTV